jgi:hypothetical protein
MQPSLEPRRLALTAAYADDRASLCAQAPCELFIMPTLSIAQVSLLTAAWMTVQRRVQRGRRPTVTQASWD